MSSRAAIACLLGTSLMAAGCDRKSQAPGQADAAADANAATAISPDEVQPEPTPGTKTVTFDRSRFDRSHRGRAAPTLSFTGPDGAPVTLAAFRGKPVLLNLWATWCAPCVAEMPTLDAAAKALDGKVVVLAVSQDLDGAAKVAPFFAQHRFGTLKPYLDPKLGLSLAYQANLPTTILLDSTGHEVWRRSGGTDWTSADAKTAIGEASSCACKPALFICYQTLRLDAP